MKGAKKFVIEKRVAFFCCVRWRWRRRQTIEHVAHNRKLIQLLLMQTESGVPVCAMCVRRWFTGVATKRVDQFIHQNKVEKKKRKCLLFGLTSKPSKMTWTAFGFFFSLALFTLFPHSECAVADIFPLHVFFFSSLSSPLSTLLFQFYVTNLLMDKMWRAKHFKMWTILFHSIPPPQPTQ